LASLPEDADAVPVLPAAVPVPEGVSEPVSESEGVSVLLPEPEGAPVPLSVPAGGEGWYSASAKTEHYMMIKSRFSTERRLLSKKG